MSMQVGNAPVSWGVFETDAPWTTTPPYGQVMDEMRAAGYVGTELGPYGYYPTEPARLRAELDARGLALASSFVPVDLAGGADPERAVGDAVRVGWLLAALGSRELILADAGHEERKATAGSGAPEPRLTDGQWREAARLVERIARAAGELGLRTVFHHHAGTYVETPDELARLCALTDPGLVGVCLDTGHYVYGGGDPLVAVREYGERVRYVHLKDVWPEKLARVRETRMPMDQAWAYGVFSPLGRGMVDFPAFVEALRAMGYGGWLIVEQDIVLDEQGRAEQPPIEAARESREYLRRECGL